MAVSITTKSENTFIDTSYILNALQRNKDLLQRTFFSCHPPDLWGKIRDQGFGKYNLYLPPPYCFGTTQVMYADFRWLTAGLLSNLLSIVCRDSLSTKENAQNKQRVGWKIRSSAYKKMSMFDNKLQLTASCWILNLILVSSATGIQDAYVKGTRLWKWIQENNLFWKLCSIYYNN